MDKYFKVDKSDFNGFFRKTFMMLKNRENRITFDPKYNFFSLTVVNDRVRVTALDFNKNLYYAQNGVIRSFFDQNLALSKFSINQIIKFF